MRHIKQMVFIKESNNVAAALNVIFDRIIVRNNTSLRFLVICLADKISVQCYCYFCHSQIQRILFWTD